MLARHLWSVIKDDHKDAIKDCQRDKLSCNDAHIEAVQKSSSELDESVTKRAEIRQKKHAEFVVSVADAMGFRSSSLSTGLADFMQVARGRVEG